MTKYYVKIYFENKKNYIYKKKKINSDQGRC